MERLKSKRIYPEVSPTIFLNETPVIWVIHANKTPPHLGISIGSKFYSLKAKGKDEGFPVSRLLQVIEEKQIATLFLELKRDAIQEPVSSVFAKYTTTIPEKITCLQPLKELVGNESATNIKELWAFLERTDCLTDVYGSQLPEGFDGIPTYDLNQIHARLRSLVND